MIACFVSSRQSSSMPGRRILHHGRWPTRSCVRLGRTCLRPRVPSPTSRRSDARASNLWREVFIRALTSSRANRAPPPRSTRAGSAAPLAANSARRRDVVGAPGSNRAAGLRGRRPARWSRIFPAALDLPAAPLWCPLTQIAESVNGVMVPSTTRAGLNLEVDVPGRCPVRVARRGCRQHDAPRTFR